ncbi:MAG: nucleotidyl transferase AbiEii/AbiGii toxin family protein [Planctomycetes bacterium]|nr:nucleotidyl transferase AbiEii/AbiGii toxin family protein [Planctomycetota bacterium]
MSYSLEALFRAAIDSLIDAGSDYMLYGGIAAGVWGEPRFTEDVDVVLFIHEREFPRFLRAAARNGFRVEEDLCIQQIQVVGWSRIPLQSRDSPWHIDVTLGDSPFDRSAFERRRDVELFGRRVKIASPEDLVVYKTISALTNPQRLQDVLDVEAVFRRMGPTLDAAYLKQWAGFWEDQGIQGTAARIEELLAKWGTR